MIGRDNQLEEYSLNDKVMALRSQTKAHPNGGNTFFECFVQG